MKDDNLEDFTIGEILDMMVSDIQITITPQTYTYTVPSELFKTSLDYISSNLIGKDVLVEVDIKGRLAYIKLKVKNRKVKKKQVKKCKPILYANGNDPVGSVRVSENPVFDN